MEKERISIDWPLVGNEEVTKFLAKSIQNKKTSSAYIFSGPENLGKNTMAFVFAQALLCEANDGRTTILPCGKCSSCRQMTIGVRSKKKKTQAFEQAEQMSIHADFYYLKKLDDKKNISVEQVREFIDKLSLSSFSGGYKVGLIKNAERLSEAAANAVLKTLEEPREKVVIILTTSQVDRLPQTIVSRCQVLDFRLVDWEKIYDFLLQKYDIGRAEAKNFSRLALGRPALAARMVENVDFRKRYEASLDAFLQALSARPSSRLKLARSIYDEKKDGQDAVRQVMRIIDVWQGVARDLLLLHFGHNDIIQHEIRRAEMISVLPHYNTDRVRRYHEVLKKAKRYLESNVAPKLVIDYISINI